MSYVSTVKNLLLIAEPVTGEFVGPLQQQPSVMAVDEQVRVSAKGRGTSQRDCDLQQLRSLPEPQHSLAVSLFAL